MPTVAVRTAAIFALRVASNFSNSANSSCAVREFEEEDEEGAVSIALV